MITRTRHVQTLVLAMLAAATVTSAAQDAIDAKNFEKGATVTLQGCVIAGERNGTFVFSRVTVWPVAHSPIGKYGPRHFWLENAGAKLAEHLGETLQVTGTISDLSESEIEREPGSSHVGNRVAIELPSGDVFTSPDYAGVAPAQLGNKTDMKITLVKVKVESLLTVMKTCLPVPK